MRDTAGREHELAGARVEFRVADLEHVLSVKHVEQLVLVLVNVERRVDGFGSSKTVKAPPVVSAEALTTTSTSPNRKSSPSMM